MLETKFKLTADNVEEAKQWAEGWMAFQRLTTYDGGVKEPFIDSKTGLINIIINLPGKVLTWVEGTTLEAHPHCSYLIDLFSTEEQ